MKDRTEVDHPDAHRRPSAGLRFAGLLVGAFLAAVLLGPHGSPDSAAKTPVRVAPTAGAPHHGSAADLARSPDLAASPDLAISSDLATLPRRDKPIGVESLTRCPVNVGGLLLGDHRRLSGWALERWDCDAARGPWSVVVMGSDGSFGAHGAVVTFPVDPGAGTPVAEPHGAIWDPGVRRLVWPLAGSHAQIVGDLGQARLANLAGNITVRDNRPALRAPEGFTATAPTPYGSTVIHEMRYSAMDLGQEKSLGDGYVYTVTMSGASFQSQVLQGRPQSAGLVRGKPAIYSEVAGGSSVLAWEQAAGELTYIGFTGSLTRPDALEALRGLANRGNALTPAQWQTKDRVQTGLPSRAIAQRPG